MLSFSGALLETLAILAFTGRNPRRYTQLTSPFSIYFYCFPYKRKSFDLVEKVSFRMSAEKWLPSLNALRAFEATARLLSYRKAADELNVTPAAVKQLVAKLEDVLGEKLVRRDGRKMALTPAGTSGIEDLSTGFRQITRSVERIRRNKTRQRLVVSVDPSFAAAWLVPRLENFKRAFPSIDVLIDSSMQIVDLEGGSAHVGIRFGIESHTGLIAHRLFDEELCAMCSPNLANASPGLSKLEDLEHATLLRWDTSQFEWATNTRRMNYWRSWLEAVGARKLRPGKGMDFTDYNLAVQAAIAGHGVILGSRPILEPLLTGQLLVDPFNLSSKPGYGYDVVTTEKALEREDVRAFVDWILNSV